MKMISKYNLLLSILTLLLVTSIDVKASATSTLEDANKVLTQAIEKMLINIKGNMYKTDTPTEFLKVGRFETNLYTGFFVTIGSTTTSAESLSRGNYFTKVMDIKKKTIYENVYGNTEYYLNNTKLATTTYFDNTYKYINGNLMETYLSSQRINDKTIKNITSFIDLKLKAKGIVDSIRNKIVNKIYNAEYIKLNQSESMSNLDTLLGLKSLSANPLDNINTKKLENNFLPSLGTLLKVKKDEGLYNVEYTYNPSVYSEKTATKTYNTRKLILAIDTDALADLSIKKNAKELITSNITQTSLNGDLKNIVKNLYGELEIDVYIDSSTYDLRRIDIPEYQFDYSLGSSTASIHFSFSGSEAYTGLKTIKLPTKFITPTTIRSSLK